MTRAATSILVFGVYLILLGLILVFAPNTLLGVFRIAPTTEVWIRLVGILVFGIALYYCAAARQDVVAFFRWTVWGRALILAWLIAFAAFRVAPAVLVIFGVIDALGATWTWFALRTVRPASAPPTTQAAA